jgi:hypothetical protein
VDGGFDVITKVNELIEQGSFCRSGTASGGVRSRENVLFISTIFLEGDTCEDMYQMGPRLSIPSFDGEPRTHSRDETSHSIKITEEHSDIVEGDIDS